MQSPELVAAIVYHIDKKTTHNEYIFFFATFARHARGVSRKSSPSEGWRSAKRTKVLSRTDSDRLNIVALAAILPASEASRRK